MKRRVAKYPKKKLVVPTASIKKTKTKKLPWLTVYYKLIPLQPKEALLFIQLRKTLKFQFMTTTKYSSARKVVSNVSKIEVSFSTGNFLAFE